MAMNAKNMIALWSSIAATYVAGVTVEKTVILDQDSDWRHQGSVEISPGAVVDLAGHALQLSDGWTIGDRKDATEPVDATRAWSTDLYAGHATCLFDNDFRWASDHRICSTRSSVAEPCEIGYDFVTPTCIDSYRLYFKSGDERAKGDRAPKDWTLQGSHDKTNWTIVDTKSGVNDWQWPDVKEFTCANSSSYRYYKLVITARNGSNCVELYQVEFFKASSAKVDMTGDGRGNVCDCTSLYAGSGDSLFDDRFVHSSDHRICDNEIAKRPFHVIWDFGEGNSSVVNAYRISYKSNGSGADRAPRNFQLMASNDREDWYILDEHYDVTDWANPSQKSFVCDNDRAYRYYAIKVLKEVANTVLEFYQLEFFDVRGNVRSSVVDLTGEGKGCVCAAAPDLYSGDDSAAKLFNDNFKHSTNQRICDTRIKDRPFYVVWDFGDGQETVVNAYRIHFKAGGEGVNRAPRNFRLLGTNDASVDLNEWDVLDQRTEIRDWHNPGVKTFVCLNSNPYRYYAFQVQNEVYGTILEFHQLEFFRTGVISYDVVGGRSLSTELGAVPPTISLEKTGSGELGVSATTSSWAIPFTVREGTLDLTALGDLTGYPVSLGGGTVRIDAGTGMSDFSLPVTSGSKGTISLVWDHDLTDDWIKVMGRSVLPPEEVDIALDGVAPHKFILRWCEDGLYCRKRGGFSVQIR